MSGHSKWANIKHRKGAQDAKRSNIFTKLTKAITIAAKNNTNLDIAVAAAREANMPKDKIQRAIDKGMGKLGDIEIVTAIYEFYGPGGVGIIVNVLTDNKNRSLSELKNICTKNNARLANAGAVSYLFDERGMINLKISKQKIGNDDIQMQIIDSGATDYQIIDDDIYVYTEPKELSSIKTKLEKSGLILDSSKIEMCPKNYIDVSEDHKKTIINLLEQIENHDDVSELFTNANL